jgi:hypothetical protein
VNGFDFLLLALLWIGGMGLVTRFRGWLRARRILRALRSNVSTRCPVFSDPRKPTQPSH